MIDRQPFLDGQVARKRRRFSTGTVLTYGVTAPATSPRAGHARGWRAGEDEARALWAFGGTSARKASRISWFRTGRCPRGGGGEVAGEGGGRSWKLFGSATWAAGQKRTFARPLHPSLARFIR